MKQKIQALINRAKKDSETYKTIGGLKYPINKYMIDKSDNRKKRPPTSGSFKKGQNSINRINATVQLQCFKCGIEAPNSINLNKDFTDLWVCPNCLK